MLTYPVGGVEKAAGRRVILGFQNGRGAPNGRPKTRVTGESDVRDVGPPLGCRHGEVVALEDVSFAVPMGSTTALLGANGAGKTTTIAMLLGLLAPSAGRITVLGEDMLRHRYRVLGRMNFSSPYVDLPLRLTVRQNLSVYAELYGLGRPAQKIDRLLGELDLQAFVDRATGKLSAGQKTRVMLAKALINDPEVLFLDEPTAS